MRKVKTKRIGMVALGLGLGLVAMIWLGAATITHAEEPAEPPPGIIVTPKEGQVHLDGSVTSGPDATVPQFASIANGQVTILSLVILPPDGWSFIPFPGTWIFADVDFPGLDYLEPELSGFIGGEIYDWYDPVTRHLEGFRVFAFFDESSLPDAGQFPLQAEGNMVPPPGGTEWKPWYWSIKTGFHFDLDVDSDNNNGFDDPSGSSMEDSIEDIAGDDSKPGKVIALNNTDVDEDGIPDYADGYDLISQAIEDDGCNGSRFVPLIIKISSYLNPDVAQVRLTYSASAPGDVDVQDDDIFVLPAEGHLRIWKKDGGTSRSKDSIISGGDYVPNGVYTLSQLGVANGYLKLYVEAVRQSQATGDLTVHGEIFVKGINQGSPSADDQIRITAVKMEIVSVSLLTDEQLPADAFLSVGLPDVQDDDNGGQAPGCLHSYRVYVDDPRATIGPLHVNDATVPFTKQGNRYVSDPFVLMTQGERDLLQQDEMFRIQVNGETLFELKPSQLLGNLIKIDHVKDIRLSYNPLWNLKSDTTVKPPKAHLEAAKVVSKVIEEMEAEGWVPANPNDPGAFGKEVHVRVTQKFSGKTNWLADVYVETGTNKILSVGAMPPGGITGTIQVDLIGLHKNYTPAIGDILDSTKIEVMDIKTSIYGLKPSEYQLGRLKAVSGGKPIGLIGAKKVYWQGAGFVLNRRISRTMKVFGLVGFATAAYAIVNADVYEYERENMLNAMENFANATDPLQKKLNGVEALNSMRMYIGRFLPDDTALNLIFWKSLINVLTE